VARFSHESSPQSGVVWVEVVLNAYVLWVNRASVPHVWRRVLADDRGLAPGVALGTTLVHRVQPAWLKLATFIRPLPLISCRQAGFSQAIRDERRVGCSSEAASAS